MATAVVSARVNQATKAQASLIAQSAGTNLGEVIKQVLEEMVRTRSVPLSSEAQQTRDRQKERFHAFMAWRSELPDSVSTSFPVMVSLPLEARLTGICAQMQRPASV